MSEEMENRKAIYNNLKNNAQPVCITGIDIPFFDMVGFMVKWAIASIPAAIILILIGTFAAAIIAAIGVGSK